MNNELLTVLNYMQKERGIDKETLILAVEEAMQSVAKKTSAGRDLKVKIDRDSCDIKAFSYLTVTEEDTGTSGEISLANARKTNPNAEVGDTIEIEATPKNFGRIAAQAAKQAIIQKIKEAERDVIFDEFKDRKGDIISGSIRQFNHSDIIVDLGRTEGIIPTKERVQTEEYQIGDRIRALIISVQNHGSGPNIVLSRSHPDFVKRLFELEVSEISDGIVSIKGIAREPGCRTKIAVTSNDEKVDPVGACVGMRGMRVKNIVRELLGEKIDIIKWSSDTKTYVNNALSPAKLTQVTVDEVNPRMVHVVADTEQLSLAIGKRGQNVRLTAKLLGLKIDITKDEADETFEEKVKRAVDNLASIDGITSEHAKILVEAGFLTIEGILASEISELVEMTGLDEDVATSILESARTQTEDKE